jgi:glycosyltransferase involved in cell wall biosynthesis
MPRVSVIMPLYNAEKYVMQAVNSILNQTYTDFELVIVDDQSTDNSYKIVQQIPDSRIRLFQNSKNLGIAQTRNIALQHVTGEYIAIMDDDDIAPLYRFENEILYLDKHKDIIAVGGHCRYIDKDGNDLGKQWNVFTNPMYINAYIIFNDPMPNSSAMIRNEIIQKYNIQYRDNMYGTEDYRFWAECSVYGFLGNINEVMLYWRTNYENETEKVFKLYSEKRRNAISETQKYLLKKLGFQLNEKEINVLVSVFEEYGHVSNIEEIQELFYILQKIVKQAKDMKMINSEEIAIMCRKRFGEKIGKAFFLWE